MISKNNKNKNVLSNKIANINNWAQISINKPEYEDFVL